jgi:hypothetical protein
MKKLPAILIALTVLIVLGLILLPFSPRLLQKLKNGIHDLRGSNPVTSSLTHIIQTNPAPGATPDIIGPLISRNLPAFTNSEGTAASNGNDDSYDTTWDSLGSQGWLAYDLSSVPANQRTQVLLAWYNETGNYNHTLIGYEAYNIPENYTIEVNAAKGGGQPPTTGWVVKTTVTANHLHSRQHVIDMNGANWIRINVTAVDGSEGNEYISINMDIYNAVPALNDDWIIYGSSSVEGALGHETINNVKALAQLVNAKDAARYPVQEDGGIGYLTTADGVKYLPGWLQLFPGKYVGLGYGNNDALDCVNPQTFYTNDVAMVEDVLHAGKVPVVPTLSWGKNANLQNCGPALNAKIAELYQAFPQIVHGPDLWDFFKAHPELISSDDIHPNDVGFGDYRQMWADVVLAQHV